jgi:hypothetical protein
VLYNKIKAAKIKLSLTLLKTNALRADLSVFNLAPQKLIRKNEVTPINSQPKKSTTRLPESTNKIILLTKRSKRVTNLSIFGSYLK